MNSTLYYDTQNISMAFSKSGWKPPVTLDGSLSALLCLATISLSIVTCGGNLMVLIAFHINKKLRTITNYFIISLACADTIVGLFSMNGFTIYVVQGGWKHGTALCDLWLSADYLASNASVLNLVIICVDRYLAITKPLTYRVKRTKNRAVRMIAMAWVVSFVLWVPAIVLWPVFEGRTVPKDQCYIQFFSNPMVTFGTAVAAFYIPTIAMIILNWKIYKVNIHHQKYQNGFRTACKWRSSLNQNNSSKSNQSREGECCDKDDRSRENVPEITYEFPDTNGNHRLTGISESDGFKNISNEVSKEHEIIKNNNRQFSDVVSIMTSTKSKCSNHNRLSCYICLDKNQNHAFSDHNRLLQPTNCKKQTIGKTNEDDFQPDIQINNDTASKRFTPVQNGSKGYSKFTQNSKRNFSRKNKHTTSKSLSCLNFVDSTNQCNTNQKKSNNKTELSSSLSDGLLMTLTPGLMTLSGDKNDPSPNTTNTKSQTKNKLTKSTSSSSMQKRDNSMYIETSDGTGNTLNSPSIRSKRLTSFASTTRNLGEVANILSVTRRNVRDRLANIANKDNKAARMLFVILVVFIMTWLPYNILVLVSTLCDGCVDELVWNLSYWLCYLNSTLNPFCYALCSDEFRKTFNQILCCQKRKSTNDFKNFT